jgi:hypothetical protein
MRFVLRNNDSAIASISHRQERNGAQSTRRMLHAALKISGTSVGSAAIAALLLSALGCSSALDDADDVGASSAPQVADDAPVETHRESDTQPEMIASDPAAIEPVVAEPEAPRASPQRGIPEAAAPSARARAGSDPAPAVTLSVDTNATPRATLQTSGRQLLDTCGKPFVVRGVEQIFGEQLPQGNDWLGLLDQISGSGVNAVRILAGTDTLGVDDVDALLDRVAEKGMAAYVTPYGKEGMQWLAGQSVRQMLAKHEKYIIIDAFGEPTFDDRERFIAESTNAIRQVRSWGYEVPLTVTANQFGRDLPSLLELGQQIVDADPLDNTILGWQAYWSQSGYYQNTYGLSLSEAVEAVARAPFPIQLGLDHVTDFPAADTADYGTLLAATEAHGVGWLWWDWYNPYGSENNLTNDGTASHLTTTGSTVLATHAASVKNTAKQICVR